MNVVQVGVAALCEGAKQIQRRGGLGVSLNHAFGIGRARGIIERRGDALLAAPDFGLSLPELPLKPKAEALLIGDFIAPLAEIDRRLKAIAGRGGRGHLVVVSDPAEETFPWSGQTEFIDPEDGFRLRIGEAGELAANYHERLAAHREGLRRIAAALGWSLTMHRTDRPASEALMRFGMALATGGADAALGRA